MFKMLNKNIPPDKALLSFESFVVNQHAAKGAFYRPEIGWYLDRPIVVARGLADIQEKAKTGKYPYYLIQKNAPWSQRTRALALQARRPDLTTAQRARIQQLLQQERTPQVQRWRSLVTPLKRLYKYQVVTGERGAKKYRKFYRVGMPDYLIFDLTSKAAAP
jgi:hypothetical protein